MNLFGATYQPGSRWGFLELLAITQTGYQDGAVWDSHGGPLIWTLRCLCGHKWDMDVTLFLGKRLTRSCGRDGCSWARGLRAAEELKRVGVAPSAVAVKKTLVPRSARNSLKGGEKSVQVCYYLTTRVVREVAGYAAARGEVLGHKMAMGRAAEELIDLGLAAVLASSE